MVVQEVGPKDVALGDDVDVLGGRKLKGDEFSKVRGLCCDEGAGMEAEWEGWEDNVVVAWVAWVACSIPENILVEEAEADRRLASWVVVVVVVVVVLLLLLLLRWMLLMVEDCIRPLCATMRLEGSSKQAREEEDSDLW